MNHIQEEFSIFAQELKPLVALYAEKYWEKDPNTGKPPLDAATIEILKTQAIDLGISARFLSLLEVEIRKSDVRLMRARKSMKQVKVEPDESWNIYHDKKRIADKILELLEIYNNQMKDSLEN